MIRRVLLGIGGTPFTTVAIQRAVELCRLHGAQLTAVTVVDQQRLGRIGPTPLGAGGAAIELREHRLAVTRERVEEALEMLKASCEADGVMLSIHREQGSPFNLMVEHARYHDVSIFGLRSMFECDVMGGDDVDPADVLSRMVIGGVRPMIAVSERFRSIRKVLVAYGGSVRAAESLKQFVHLQPWPDVSLRLLTCEQEASEARRLLSDAASYCRLHGFEPELQVRPGSPREEILAEAEAWDADLVVLGISRGSLLTRKIFGTTALEVIRKIDRPLFLGR